MTLAAKSSRRRFLRGSVALAAWCSAPSFSKFDGALTLLPQAQAAAWLGVAQLALTALSQFVRQDNGMEAMLTALKELSEENIRLTQQVLVQLGQVEAQIKLFPLVMKKQLAEHSEYRVREDTEDVLGRLSFAEPRIRSRDRAVRASVGKELETVVSKCMDLARFRSVPYGLGMTGAMCAPLVAAIDARARRLLGRSSDIPHAIQTFYLPWLRNIQSPNRDGSLVVRMLDAFKELTAEYNVDDDVPEILRASLRENFTKVTSADAGAAEVPVDLTCASHNRRTGWRNGDKCLQVRCPPNRNVPAAPPSGPSARIEAYIDRGSGIASDLIDCWCTRFEQVPAYSPITRQRLVAVFRNTFGPIEEAGGQPGPTLTVDTKWMPQGDAPAPPCTVFSSEGEASDAAEVKAIHSSESAKSWELGIEDLGKRKIAPINDLRRSIYAMNTLMQSTRAAQALLERVST